MPVISECFPSPPVPGDPTGGPDTNFHSTTAVAAPPQFNVHTLAPNTPQTFPSGVVTTHNSPRHIPIFRLPNEILIMIFILVNNTQDPWAMLRYLCLTWICHHWREVALEASVLWTVIELAHPRAEEILVEILPRSKAAKLLVGQKITRTSYMSVGWGDDMGLNPFDTSPNAVGECALFKEHIIPVLDRVECLELKLPRNLWMEILPVLRTPVPSLRHCRFKEIPYSRLTILGTDIMQLDDEDAFASVPSEIIDPRELQVLMIRYEHLSLFRMPTSFQAPNLRELGLSSGGNTMDSPTLEEILMILESCCSRLESLIIGCVSYISEPLSRPRIVMDRLCHLVLEKKKDAVILEYLTTPSLQKLRIDARGISPTSCISRCLDLESFHHMRIDNGVIFGCRGKGRVLSEDLRIITCGMKSMPGFLPQLREWARHLSSLRLGIPDSSSRTQLPRYVLEHAHALHSIHTNYSQRGLLPCLKDKPICLQLESLAFDYGYSPKSPGKELVPFLKSRREGGTPLKELTVLTPSAMLLDDASSDILAGLVDKFTPLVCVGSAGVESGGRVVECVLRSNV